MQFIDTHTHPYDEAFDQDRDQAMLRAMESGVGRWIFPAIDSTSFKAQLSLWEKYPSRAFMGMGLHPTSVGENWKEELRFAMEELDSNPDRYVAVGEIGLDYHYSPETRDAQCELFARQLDLANMFGLPVVIHTRDADDDTLGILREIPSKGIIHCFTGSPSFCRALLDLGFYISISGIVTFRAAENVRESARIVPDGRLLIETDSPFLAPVPMRGNPNEPAFLVHTARFLADLRGMPLEDLAALTTRNALSILGGIR